MPRSQLERNIRENEGTPRKVPGLSDKRISLYRDGCIWKVATPDGRKEKK